MPRKRKDRPFGKRLMRLRKDRGFTLKKLSEETGLGSKHISSIEKGEVIPSVSNILRISRALGVDSSLLLQQERKHRKKQSVEEYRKRTEDYTYETLTPGAAHKHIKAFKVFVEPKTEHKPVTYQHLGEEFQYVLRGKVEVTVGENKHILERGDSVHFNSSILHKLRNVGSEKAELVVVLYTP